MVSAPRTHTHTQRVACQTFWRRVHTHTHTHKNTHGRARRLCSQLLKRGLSVLGITRSVCTAVCGSVLRCSGPCRCLHEYCMERVRCCFVLLCTSILVSSILVPRCVQGHGAMLGPRPIPQGGVTLRSAVVSCVVLRVLCCVSQVQRWWFSTAGCEPQ